MILKIHCISYQMNLQATNLSTQRNKRKKRKSQGKHKLNQDKCETPKIKKRNDVTSAQPIAPVTAVTPIGHVTPATQKGRGKMKGKSSTPNHHLLLLLILMIMDHLFLMLLRKHCRKVRFQISWCTTTEYKVAATKNVTVDGIPSL